MHPIGPGPLSRWLALVNELRNAIVATVREN
jgi:hypothetical protein